MHSIELIEAEIKDIILNGDEHPTAMQLVESVVGTDPFKFALYLKALNNLENEGYILYDGKHDAWIWTKPSKKMLEWMKKCTVITR